MVRVSQGSFIPFNVTHPQLRLAIVGLRTNLPISYFLFLPLTSHVTVPFYRQPAQREFAVTLRGMNPVARKGLTAPASRQQIFIKKKLEWLSGVRTRRTIAPAQGELLASYGILFTTQLRAFLQRYENLKRRLECCNGVIPKFQQ